MRNRDTRRSAASGRVRAAILLGACAAAALSLVNSPLPIGWDLGLLAHVSGLLAGYIVAVMVLLMARVPYLEHEVGADRMSRWHAFGGRTFIVAMLVHAVTATVAWATALQENPLAAVLQVLGFPGMVAALVGTVIFCLVAILSVRAARKRLTYETWHSVHLLTYIALALSFVHELAGPNLAGYPALQLIWSLLFAIPLGLVARYRVLRPLEQAIRHRLAVQEVIPEAAGVFSVILSGHHLEELQAQSGQFFRWRFLTGTTWRSAHPFSLSAAPGGKHLRITVKTLGDGSARLASLRPGTLVLAEGPYGALTEARRERPSVLLIGGGIGITPMRALFETIDTSQGDVTLIYRASQESDIVFRSELEEIAHLRGGKLIWMLGPSSDPANSFQPANLLQLVPDLAARDIYLCASPRLADAVRRGLRAAGVPSNRLHEETFAF